MLKNRPKRHPTALGIETKAQLKNSSAAAVRRTAKFGEVPSKVIGSARGNRWVYVDRVRGSRRALGL